MIKEQNKLAQNIILSLGNPDLTSNVTSTLKQYLMVLVMGSITHSLTSKVS